MPDRDGEGGEPPNWEPLIDVLQSAEDSEDDAAALELRLLIQWLRLRGTDAREAPRWQQLDYDFAQRSVNDLMRKDAADLAWALADTARRQAERARDSRRQLAFGLKAAQCLVALRRYRAAEQALREALRGPRGVAVDWVAAVSCIESYSLTWSDQRTLKVAAHYTCGRLLASLGRYHDADRCLVHALELAERTDHDLPSPQLALLVAELRVDAGDLPGFARLRDAWDEQGLEPVMRDKWRLLAAAAQLLRGDWSAAEAAFRELEEANRAGTPRLAAAARWYRVATLAKLNRLDEAEELAREIPGDRPEVARFHRLLQGRRALGATTAPGPSELIGSGGPEPSSRPGTQSDFSASPRLRGFERFREEFAARAQEVLLALDASDLESAKTQFSWLALLCEPVQSLLVRAELHVLQAQLNLALREPLAARRHAVVAEEAFARLELPAQQREACMLQWLSHRDRVTSEAEARRQRMDELAQLVQAGLTPRDERLFLLNKWASEDWRIRALIDGFERESERRGLPARLRTFLRSRRIFRLLGEVDRSRGWDARTTRREDAASTPAAGAHDELGSTWSSPPAHGLPLRALGPRWLAPNAALFYYVSLPDRLVVFSLARGGCDYQTLPTSRAALWQLAERLFRALQEVQADASHAEAVNREFVRALGLDRLLSRLPSGLDHVYIVPDDVLVHVPFGALRLEQGFLCERFSLSLVPYPRWVCDERAQAPFASALTVADPELPNARAEAMEFANAVAEATQLEGDSATRENVLAALARHELAHFACHGHFDPARPQRSGLQLARSGDRLVVSDLKGYTLSHLRFAFLHACWTANIRVLPGRELVGLASTFVRLGCHAVITALWAVPDPTALDFARALRPHIQTAGAARALALTQGTWTAKSPQTWAHYVVYERGLRTGRVAGRVLAWFLGLRDLWQRHRRATREALPDTARV